MLGHRGCRLISYPAVTAMQVEAILEAAHEVQKKGTKVPQRSWCRLLPMHVNLNSRRTSSTPLPLMFVKAWAQEKSAKVHTMIEIPRAAITAGEVAKHAEFFSFGTNDLTQTGLLSRDDSSSFLPTYQDEEVLIITHSQVSTKKASLLNWVLKVVVRLKRNSRSVFAASTVAILIPSSSSTVLTQLRVLFTIPIPIAV